MSKLFHSRASHATRYDAPHFLRVVVLTAIGTVLACVRPAQSQFTTVINAPPTTIQQSSRINSNTQVNVFDGGSVKNSVRLGRDLTSTNIEFNVYGGTVGTQLEAFNGAELNVFGGSIGNSLKAYRGSEINIYGGTVGAGLTANDGSIVNLSGGALDAVARAKNGSIINITGGSLGRGFIGEFGSTVNIFDGTIGESFAASGLVNISGGNFGRDFSSSDVANISGGTFGQNFQIRGTVNMSGGAIEWVVNVNDRAELNMSGGMIGSSLTVRSDGVANISGGILGRFTYLYPGAQLNISGGSIGSFLRTTAGSATMLSGNDFRLNGLPISGLETLGSTLPFTLPEGSSLTGVLADGTPFAFSSHDEDRFPDGTLTLKSATLPDVGPAHLNALTDPVPIGIRNGQMLVVPAGATVPQQLMAGEGSTVAISGGNLGHGAKAIGSHVTMTSGIVGGYFGAWHGSVVDISGGLVDEYMRAFSGSQINIAGGLIRDELRAFSGSTINLAGGTVGDQFEVDAGAALNIMGGEFRLNGALISGLDVVGSMSSINIPNGGVLSGTLADGTPFAFSSIDRDIIADGTVTLNAAALPAIGPAVINVPSDAVPLGIRSGQTLNLAEGGVVSDQFNAGWGSTVHVTGGDFGKNFEAVGAEVNISAGTIGGDFTAWHSSVTITGGTINSVYPDQFRIAGDSVVNISGGELKQDTIVDHSTANISGGNIEDLDVSNQSTVNVAGGTLDVNRVEQSTINIYGGDVNLQRVRNGIANIYGGKIDSELTGETGSVINVFGGMIGSDFDIREGSQAHVTGGIFSREFTARAGSAVHIAGGALGDQFEAEEGSQLHLTGGDFRINGIPISGLDAVGNAVAINLPEGSLLSGTLANGTPVAFLSYENDTINDGTLTLHAATIAPGPATFNVPSDSPPTGVHAGQTITVSDGGTLANNFNAGRGSNVVITGGQIGENFEAVGANVQISGGTVGRLLDAFQDSVIHISGGTVGSNLQAYNGSVVHISGGTVGGGLQALSGSDVTISGGTVAAHIDALGSSRLKISGGSVGTVRAEDGAQVDISGGVVELSVSASNGGRVNVSGGTLNGGIGVAQGSQISISGGTVNATTALTSDSSANISGGEIRRLRLAETATVNISGGSIGSHFVADGVVNISGGAFGDRYAAGFNSKTTIAGGEFRLNGQPIAGLEQVGDSIPIALAGGETLSGTFADGTPFAFAPNDQDLFRGTWTLTNVALPAAVPAHFNLPSDAAPLGIRNGQTLHVADGGNLADNFTAGPGSNVVISGGQVGHNFEAIGAHVTISGGAVGEEFDAMFGSVVEMSGGFVGSYVELLASRLELAGGTLGGRVFADNSSLVNISGGEVTDDLFSDSTSVMNISSGVIYGRIFAEGTSSISGGALRGNFYTQSGASMTLFGSDFRIDGIPVAGLDATGDTVPINIPENSVLSGTLADGTPFINERDEYISSKLADGTLRLVAASPIVGPTLINLPSDPTPLGVHRNQTLIVGAGATLPRGFSAGHGSRVIVAGGVVEEAFEAVGANVEINAGAVGGGLQAWNGTSVEVLGGVVGNGVTARGGGVIKIAGGSVGDDLHVFDHSRLEISAGRLGDNAVAHENTVVDILGGSVGDNFQAAYQTVVNLAGGSVGNRFRSGSLGIVNQSGGTVGDYFAIGRDTLTIFGDDFRVDGQPIIFDDDNAIITQYLARHTLLTGTLSDGTPFAFNGGDGDGSWEIWGLSIQLKSVPTASVAAPEIHVPTSAAPLGVRAGQTLFVDTGGVLSNHFNAGLGGVVNILDGQVGDNFEAVGAEVNISGGTIGSEFDAFNGSIINIMGGSIGNDFTAHPGSIVNISGGSFDSGFEVMAGARVHLIGAEFQLNGLPIDGLILGQELLLSERNKTLSGLFADGTPFSFHLGDENVARDFGDTRFFQAAELMLTIVPVPEPASATLLGIALSAVALRRRKSHNGRSIGNRA